MNPLQQPASPHSHPNSNPNGIAKAQNHLGSKSTLRMKQNWYIHFCYCRKVSISSLY
jgi:hypothetical protein